MFASQFVTMTGEGGNEQLHHFTSFLTILMTGSVF